LILASKRGLVKVVELLLNRDIYPDIWASDKTGKTALKWAEENKFDTIVTLLINFENQIKHKFNLMIDTR